MECLYLPTLDPSWKEATIEDDQFHHLRVLRAKPGEYLYCVNGKGIRATGIIREIHRSRAYVEIIRIEESPDELPYTLTVVVGILSERDRMEWLVEKCVELGVKQIVLVSMERCTQRSIQRLERLVAKMIAALKQSHRSVLPQLHYSTILPDVFQFIGTSDIILCDRGGSQPVVPQQDVALIIGPEGGLSESELNFLEPRTSGRWKLSSFRLRTETAVLAASSLVCSAWTSHTVP